MFPSIEFKIIHKLEAYESTIIELGNVFSPLPTLINIHQLFIKNLNMEDLLKVKTNLLYLHRHKMG